MHKLHSPEETVAESALASQTWVTLGESSGSRDVDVRPFTA
jgi:hypothetical protein